MTTYSEDGNVTYKTGPVPSFLWYTLKKSFESVGIIVKESITKNAPQLNLVITSFNDEEAKFLFGLSRNGYLLMQKEKVVTQKLPLSENIDELGKRQFTYFDLIAASILDDPDFKKAFFSDKGKIN